MSRGYSGPKNVSPPKPAQLPSVRPPPPTHREAIRQLEQTEKHLKVFNILREVCQEFIADSAATMSKNENGQVVSLHLFARDADAFVLHALFDAEVDTQLRWLKELGIEVPKELMIGEKPGVKL
jgi:hypothetical protein